MNCPNDAAPLQETELEHIAVHGCGTCSGVWVAKEDFDLFATATAHGEGGAKPCPQCGEPLTATVYPDSKVQVDVCPQQHGVWLDKGEFDKIVLSLDEFTNQMSTKELGRATIEQFKQIFVGSKESRRSEIKDFVAAFRLLEIHYGVEHPALARAVTILSQEGI